MSQEEKVKFKFVKTPDHRIVFANGVYGGMTARGNFVMHFFHEYLPPPPIEVATFDKEGRVQQVTSVRSPEEEEAGRPVYTRDLVVSVTVPPEQAVSIANWILEKVKVIPIQEKKEVPSA